MSEGAPLVRGSSQLGVTGSPATKTKAAPPPSPANSATSAKSDGSDVDLGAMFRQGTARANRRFRAATISKLSPEEAAAAKGSKGGKKKVGKKKKAGGRGDGGSSDSSAGSRDGWEKGTMSAGDGKNLQALRSITCTPLDDTECTQTEYQISFVASAPVPPGGLIEVTLPAEMSTIAMGEISDPLLSERRKKEWRSVPAEFAPRISSPGANAAVIVSAIVCAAIPHVVMVKLRSGAGAEGTLPNECVSITIAGVTNPTHEVTTSAAYPPQFAVRTMDAAGHPVNWRGAVDMPPIKKKDDAPQNKQQVPRKPEPPAPVPAVVQKRDAVVSVPKPTIVEERIPEPPVTTAPVTTTLPKNQQQPNPDEKAGVTTAPKRVLHSGPEQKAPIVSKPIAVGRLSATRFAPAEENDAPQQHKPVGKSQTFPSTTDGTHQNLNSERPKPGKLSDRNTNVADRNSVNLDKVANTPVMPAQPHVAPATTETLPVPVVPAAPISEAPTSASNDAKSVVASDTSARSDKLLAALTSIGLVQHLDRFRMLQIEPEAVLEMDHDDLAELGVTVEEQKAIVSTVRSQGLVDPNIVALSEGPSEQIQVQPFDTAPPLFVQETVAPPVPIPKTHDECPCLQTAAMSTVDATMSSHVTNTHTDVRISADVNATVIADVDIPAVSFMQISLPHWLANSIRSPTSEISSVSEPSDVAIALDASCGKRGWRGLRPGVLLKNTWSLISTVRPNDDDDAGAGDGEMTSVSKIHTPISSPQTTIGYVSSKDNNDSDGRQHLVVIIVPPPMLSPSSPTPAGPASTGQPSSNQPLDHADEGTATHSAHAHTHTVNVTVSVLHALAFAQDGASGMGREHMDDVNVTARAIYMIGVDDTNTSGDENVDAAASESNKRYAHSETISTRLPYPMPCSICSRQRSRLSMLRQQVIDIGKEREIVENDVVDIDEPMIPEKVNTPPPPPCPECDKREGNIGKWAGKNDIGEQMERKCPMCQTYMKAAATAKERASVLTAANVAMLGQLVEHRSVPLSGGVSSASKDRVEDDEGLVLPDLFAMGEELKRVQSELEVSLGLIAKFTSYNGEVERGVDATVATRMTNVMMSIGQHRSRKQSLQILVEQLRNQLAAASRISKSHGSTAALSQRVTMDVDKDVAHQEESLLVLAAEVEVLRARLALHRDKDTAEIQKVGQSLSQIKLEQNDKVVQLTVQLELERKRCHDLERSAIATRHRNAHYRQASASHLARLQLDDELSLQLAHASAQTDELSRECAQLRARLQGSVKSPTLATPRKDIAAGADETHTQDDQTVCENVVATMRTEAAAHRVDLQTLTTELQSRRAHAHEAQLQVIAYDEALKEEANRLSDCDQRWMRVRGYLDQEEKDAAKQQQLLHNQRQRQRQPLH